MKKAVTLACLCLIALLAIPVYQQERGTRRGELPRKSYEYPPEKPPTPDDYVIKFNQMRSFYDVPGEFGHIMIGKDHGFKSLSFIVTETHPGGGPPLHTHESEEAHVLLEGKATYLMENPVTHERRVFTVQAPYITRIPAGFQHTFINDGNKIFNLVAVFPDDKLTYNEIGKNPLVKK